MALTRFYREIYGEDSLRCLVTQSNESLQATQLVRTRELALYAYCLGFNLGGLDVECERNQFYLKADRNFSFDAGKWLLLPDMVTLREVHDFFQRVIDYGKDPKWFWSHTMHSKPKTKYTLLPLPGLERAPFFRRTLDPAESWQPHSYPYQTLPPFECHISPLYAVMNAAPKCAGADLDAIVRACCQTNEMQTLKDRLELLCETWNLFDNAKGNAKARERGERVKRKRERDDEDIERLSQSSRRGIRSQSHSSRGSAGRKSVPGVKTIGARYRGSSTNVEQTQASDTHERHWIHSSSRATLTEDAVSRLGKREQTDLNSMIKCWAESTSKRKKKHGLFGI